MVSVVVEDGHQQTPSLPVEARKRGLSHLLYPRVGVVVEPSLKHLLHIVWLDAREEHGGDDYLDLHAMPPYMVGLRRAMYPPLWLLAPVEHPKLTLERAPWWRRVFDP